MDTDTQISAGTPWMLEELVKAAHYQFDPMSLWHFGAAVVSVGLGVLILHRDRGSRISVLFAGFCALFALWAGGRGLLRLLLDPALVLGVARWIYVLIMLALPFLFQFILTVLRLDTARRNVIRVNWVIGVCFALLSIGTPWMVTSSAIYPWGYEPLFGRLGMVSAVWIAGLMAFAGVDAVNCLRRSRPGSRERKRLTLFAIALGVLYLSFVDVLTSMGVTVYPMAFAPISVFTMLTAYITYRYGMVEVSAQLAADQIASLVRGALLVLDADGLIQFVNNQAEAILARSREQLIGQHAQQVIGGELEPNHLALMSRLEGREAEREFMYTGSTGAVRDLSLSVASVRDRQSRDIAYVCLLRDVTDQKQIQQQRLSEGLRDPLTGLPGRGYFLQALDGAVARARDQKEFDFAVCFIGVDRLNIINEDLGYAAGDQALTEVARRLRRVARAQDVVARIGGDEYGVLLESAHSQDVQRFTERAQEAIHTPLRLSDHDVHLSISCGVAESTLLYHNGAEILRDAGMAMHRVKHGGGGGAHVVNRSERGEQRTRLEADLRHAIDAKELRVYYQPVLDLVERRVAGFEALVRWHHPQRGLVMPGAFIELAEQIGLAKPIDYFVMEQACADHAKLQDLVRDRRLSMSFNAAEACMRDPQFPDRVGAALARNGLEPGSVRIEVLERVAMVAPLAAMLNKLRGLGLGLAVDDFGTGYSSLSRLHELPLTVLKVDREFVRALSGKSGEKIVAAILALARSLGLTVIAEGASQAREARRLRDLGCRLVQGFYFSQAVPFDMAMSMVREPDRFFGEKFALLESAAASAQPLAEVRATPAAIVANNRFGAKISKWFGSR